MNSKDLWDLASAMQVLTHDTVDSKLWAEAVEWLILHGPPEIRQLLLDASMTAASSSFPGLKPTYFSPDGQAYYDLKELARSLGIDEEEAKRILQQKEADHPLLHFLDDHTNKTVH